jgi:hypothetical protein
MVNDSLVLIEPHSFGASRTEIVRTSTSPIRGRVMNPPVMERVSSMKKSVRFEGDGVGSLGRT